MVEAGHIDTALRQIMDMVLERVAAAATLPPWPNEGSTRCVCTDLVSVTERAALAGGRFLGSGDEHAAREARRRRRARARSISSTSRGAW